MTNLERLNFELAEKDYFSSAEKREEIYSNVLEENFLDPYEDYSKENDQVNMMECVYTILSMLANNIEMFIKTETEFTTTSAAYQYLNKRLADLRAEIDRIKAQTHYEDERGNTSGLVHNMFYNN